MRTTLFALALVLVACGRSDRAGTPAAANAPSASPTSRGADQIALRFPRGGGRVQAYAYPRLDSVLWTSTASAPPLERVLAFDDDAGSVAAVDTRGTPVRVDLRLGRVARESAPRLTHLASADGWAIYGVTKDGAVMRLTPGGSATWTYKPPAPARELYPQPDGSLLILGDSAKATTVWHLRPPETRVMHAAVLPRTAGAVRTQAGDRVYFTVDTALIGVRSRDLATVPSVRLKRRVRSVVTTPSGDRVYVASDSSREVTVIDRYRESVDSRIELPGLPAELRMDATGRYVLARAVRGDSAWVLAVGTDSVLGAVHTAWRRDLPVIAPDGRIVALRGDDVVLVDSETLRDRRRIAGGGRDLWYFITWNGFRPTTGPGEEPTPIAVDSAAAPTDSAAVTDSTAARLAADNPFAGQIAGRDSAAVGDTTAPPAPPAAPSDTARPAVKEFTVQFAALRDEETAREIAQAVRSGSVPPPVATTTRVVTSSVAGSTIYRVVAGPFRTREEAERAAQETGRTYWIYEGAP